MNETVKPEDFKGKSLIIATPCYGGKADVPYILSLNKLSLTLYKFGIPHDTFLISGESLVTRARNNCVARFMASDFTHMIFIDADGEFNHMDALKFLYADEDVLAGAVPKKQLPIRYNTSVIKDGSGNVITHKDKFIEIEYAGCAFMMIKKRVIEKMFKHYKHLKYHPYPEQVTSINPGLDAHDSFYKKFSDSCYALFDTEISYSRNSVSTETARYFAEDYMFCKRWRDIGGRILLDPTVKINHIGQYAFEGDLSKL